VCLLKTSDVEKGLICELARAPGLGNFPRWGVLFMVLSICGCGGKN
jgi:hypothetical protein